MIEQVIRVIDLIPGERRSLQTIDANDISPHEFWSKYVCRSKPVILQGAAKSWPALEKWESFDYLQRACNDESVLMSRRFNSHPSGPYYQYASVRRNLKDCLGEIYDAAEGATYSIAGTPVPVKWDADLGDYLFLRPQRRRRTRGYPEKRLFIYKNAATDWHYHPLDETITTQLLGSKRVSLFRLNSKNWDDFSVPIRANLQHLPDGHSFFPKDEKIVKYDGVICPGDSIYIPPFWWHGVDPEDANVGITLAHCFKSPISRLGSWTDPASSELFRDISNLRTNEMFKIMLKLSAASILTLSTLKRKLSGEEWQTFDSLAS